MRWVFALALTFVLFRGESLQAQIPLVERFIIVTNEANINTENLEYSPTFYEDGILFISTKVAAPKYQIKDKNIGQNIMSIYRSRRDENGRLKAPVVFASELLSPYHEGPVSFNRTNDQIFFTRNDISKDRQKVRRLMIYMSEKNGEKWGDVQELPFNQAESDACHPSLSVDGDTLYFASNRDGGSGGMDIWMTVRTGDNEWSEPENLGPNVNTEQNEVFPFIHADGTLYFSSNRLGGAGSLDLYYVVPEGQGWSEAVNLGKPFNSKMDDFGFIVDRDNRNGYFSSNRYLGAGKDDIYQFNIGLEDELAERLRKKRAKSVPVEIIDPETGEPLEDVNISYISLDDVLLGGGVFGEDGNKGVLTLEQVQEGNELKFRLSVDSTTALQKDSTGKIQVWEGNYVLKIEKEGYQPRYTPVTREVLETGIKIPLEKAVDCLPFKATVLEESGSFPQPGAEILITNLTDGEQFSLTSDANGVADYCLPCGYTFSVMVQFAGQITDVSTVSTIPCSRSRVLSKTLRVSGASFPLVEGTVIQLPNIYFNFNDATLRPDAKRDLNSVAALLKMFPGIGIELASHTDSRGTERYNSALSSKRSESAMNYLLEQGVDPAQLVAKGYGEQFIRNRCVDGVRCSEVEHQFNRRTEVVLVRVDGQSPVSEAEDAYPVAQTATSGIMTGTRYYVIAGTFGVEDNALARKAKLLELGFDGAEIIRFELSPYQAVCVGKYDSDSQAKELANSLQDQYQISTYVREVQETEDLK